MPQQPKPVYLSPGTDPTQVEREPAAPGFRRYIYVFIALAAFGLGFFFASGQRATAASPTPTRTLTPSITATLRPHETPSATLSPTPSLTPTGTLPASTTPSATQCVLTVHVLRGGTLWWIARAFHSSPDAIAKATGLKNEAAIYPGQRLDIPCTATP